VWAAAVLSTAVVAGGWLVQRGLLFKPAAAAHVSDQHLFAEVFTRVKREYVDSLADTTLYVNAARGAVDELDDPGSVYVPAGTLTRNPDTLAYVSGGATSHDVPDVGHLQMLTNGAGYVAVNHLTDATAGDLRRAVDALVRAGGGRLIMDLRGVMDGEIPQAVSVARLFLDSGKTVVRVRGRRAMDSATYAATAAQAWPALRVALLADSTTFGAAEVVCGALQDHDRATIVGGHTVGVGGTQTVFHLASGGALALTTGAWFTPSGRPIELRQQPTDGKKKPPMVHTDAGRPVPAGGGITPDVAVSAIPLPDQDGQPSASSPVRDPVVRAALAALAKPIA
jgi:C-terminal processing protease CtpA/Prc